VSILFGAVFLCSTAGLKLIQSQIENQNNSEGSLNELISDQLGFSIIGTLVIGILFLLGGIAYRMYPPAGKWPIIAGIALFLVATLWYLGSIWNDSGLSSVLFVGIGFWLLFAALFTFMGISILKQQVK
jgi:hypothetical protein